MQVRPRKSPKPSDKRGQQHSQLSSRPLQFAQGRNYDHSPKIQALRTTTPGASPATHPLCSLSSAPRLSKLWYSAECSRAGAAMGVRRTPSAGAIISARRDSVAAPCRGAGCPAPDAPFAESPACRCWFHENALFSPSTPLSLPRLSVAPPRRRFSEHWRRSGVKVGGSADFAAPTLLMQSSKSELRQDEGGGGRRG